MDSSARILVIVLHTLVTSNNLQVFYSYASNCITLHFVAFFIHRINRKENGH